VVQVVVHLAATQVERLLLRGKVLLAAALMMVYLAGKVQVVVVQVH
jgi:hypothetical protein